MRAPTGLFRLALLGAALCFGAGPEGPGRASAQTTDAPAASVRSEPGCSAGPAPSAPGGDSRAIQAPPGQPVQVTGWFTTIWGGAGPRYFVTDDQGRGVEVLLDEGLARPFGGPLGLDRQRVRIAGEAVSASPVVVRASSIDFDRP